LFRPGPSAPQSKYSGNVASVGKKFLNAFIMFYFSSSVKMGAKLIPIVERIEFRKVTLFFADIIANLNRHDPSSPRGGTY
jgi:hypothetical protein